MTEEDAKTKWCPFARLIVGKPGTPALVPAHNVCRMGGEEDRPKCIASACMAWRWQWRQGKESGAVFQSTISGWCGLAGEDLSP